MGKVDDQRAMREAKYASRQRSAAGLAPTPPKAATARPRPAASTQAADAPAASTQTVTAPVSAATDELCGHRSIGNKSCTREKGHQASGTKNHRYA